MKKRPGANMAVEYMRYFAGWVDKLEGATIPVHPGRVLDYTVPEPYGTVAAHDAVERRSGLRRP